MNKRIAAVLGTLVLVVALSACGDDTECDGSGKLGDVTTMAMVDGRSGGSSGGGGSRSGSSGGSGSKSGGKVSSSGGSSGGKAKDHKPGGSKKVKVDDDLFEECDD